MPSFFYGNSLSLWKWTFPEGLGGLCHTCGNSGWGVISSLQKWKIQGGGGVLSEIPSMEGGGVWIFSGTTHCLCRFAKILHAKQSHQSGWTRVIGKILALNQRHFDTEKNYVPGGIIFYWLFKYGTRTSSCICYSYGIPTKLIRSI